MQQPKFCGNCGKPTEGKAFCAHCGAFIGTTTGNNTLAPVAAAPVIQTVSPLRTVTREYASDQHRRRDMDNMTEHGWQVQNIAHVAGKYKGSQGCLLFLLFAPLALLAGRTPDNWIVTYGTIGQTAVPPIVGVRPSEPKRDLLVLGKVVLAAIIIFAIMALVTGMH